VSGCHNAGTHITTSNVSFLLVDRLAPFFQLFVLASILLSVLEPAAEFDHCLARFRLIKSYAKDI
jgi:hypothetical protein